MPFASPSRITGKERDAETGLDNFRARYFGSSLGRFTSPDPLTLLKQKLIDPQQWNMYSYARNNPLTFLDPTGMYVCKGTEQQCKAAQTLINQNLKSKDPAVRAAAKAYGPLSKKAGDKGDNGVSVKFGGRALQGNLALTQFTQDKKGVVVRLDADLVTTGAKAEKNSDADVQARAAVAHEGVHVRDYKADIANKFDAAHDMTIRQSEHNAYPVTDAVVKESGRSLAGGVDLSSPAGIDQHLNSAQPGANLDVPISTNVESEPD